MFSLLLAIIYIAFISLGLPDSLLGSAWPVMHGALGAPLSAAGMITVIISCGTIVSSLLSDRLTRRFGAGAVTAVSVMMTACALFGFSVSRSLVALCLFAVPYGFGAGGVDAALNNYVALHYAARHMSWLHCFWGVGAAVSPYIMSYAISGGAGWSGGYRYVAYVQIFLTAFLFLSLPLWKKQNGTACGVSERAGNALPLRAVLRLRGAKYVFLTFFCYCALETTSGLWASSFLFRVRGTAEATAAAYASLFYLGITLGRFLCGFITERVGDKRMIRAGICTIFAGIIFIALPYGAGALSFFGLVLTGFGCAPIYPSVIHATPVNFGAENSQAVIGVQMACAYLGSTVMPPVFGLVAQHINIGLYPMYLGLFAVLMLIASERLNCTLGKER